MQFWNRSVSGYLIAIELAAQGIEADAQSFSRMGQIAVGCLHGAANELFFHLGYGQRGRIPFMCWR